MAVIFTKLLSTTYFKNKVELEYSRSHLHFLAEEVAVDDMEIRIGDRTIKSNIMILI
ncbi:hypothetical protein [Coleofasciculus sp. G2-EDA-02]|uniref:hypothetical protein n=1 Tax=Coleofasciculus sp. G2-EDA-02 TaxID=3069529 RepID=UPI0032F81426